MNNWLPGLAAVAGAMASTLCVAAENPSEASTVTFTFENDLFAGSDNQYTNGMQLGWLSPDLKHYADEQRLPRLLLPLVNLVPFSNQPDRQHNIGFTLGQLTFTPGDTQARGVVLDDRPYAGWLYGGLSFISKGDAVLDSFELQLGVVGPASLAEEAQAFVHEIRGFDTPRGWSHQLSNEPGIDLIYQHKRRVLRSAGNEGIGYDVITTVGGALGNIFTYLNAGVETRVGWNLPSDFGTSLILPGGDTNAPNATSDPRLRNQGRVGLYVFAAVAGRLVARDIFLDGNTFASSHSVDKELLVGDAVVGASLVLSRWKLSFSRALRTQEFTRQPDEHNFGSISLSYTF